MMPFENWVLAENESEGERLYLPDDLSGSFSEKIRRGWTKEQLMRYYCISEEKFIKVCTFLDVLHPHEEKPNAGGAKP